ncbi:hypothetical protein EIM50_16925 [Pseudoxanthomonas sp. SGD-10]|nr:hypothetical protein EIM50_16925 [Pseudoxanthomonas sp. SGD-10]
MKQLGTLIAFVFLTLNIYATTQVGDIINYKGKQYVLYSLPLQQHPDFKDLNEMIMSKVGKQATTACAYQAEWEVIDDLVYLISIKSCGSANESIQLNLAALFGESFKDGRVKANWINDKLFVQQGEVLHYSGGFGSIYQWELELTVVNGEISANRQLDNTYMSKSVFTKDPDSVKNFVHKHIRWNEVPDLKDKQIRVNLLLQTTGTTRPVVSLLNNKDDFYSKESPEGCPADSGVGRLL